MTDEIEAWRTLAEEVVVLCDNKVADGLDAYDLAAALLAACDRIEALEGALRLVREDMPHICRCDPAYSERSMRDPECGYHDYGAYNTRIIDDALASRPAPTPPEGA